MGVTHAVTGLPFAAGDNLAQNPDALAQIPVGQRPWDFAQMLLMMERFRDAGLTVDVIESAPPMHKLRMRQPGWEQELEYVCTMIESMGAVGITVWGYNWMAEFNWQRTSITTRTRGGAFASSFDYALVK